MLWSRSSDVLYKAHKQLCLSQGVTQRNYFIQGTTKNLLSFREGVTWDILLINKKIAIKLIVEGFVVCTGSLICSKFVILLKNC